MPVEYTLKEENPRLWSEEVLMAFRTRNPYSLGGKLLGILLAVAGITILIRTLPQWFWWFIFGTMLIVLGWFLYFRR